MPGPEVVQKLFKHLFKFTKIVFYPGFFSRFFRVILNIKEYTQLYSKVDSLRDKNHLKFKKKRTNGHFHPQETVQKKCNVAKVVR